MVTRCSEDVPARGVSSSAARYERRHRALRCPTCIRAPLGASSMSAPTWNGSPSAWTAASSGHTRVWARGRTITDPGHARTARRLREEFRQPRLPDPGNGLARDLADTTSGA